MELRLVINFSSWRVFKGHTSVLRKKGEFYEFQLSSVPERFFVGRVAVSEKKQLVGLGLLEEDEEFKEFPAEEWAGLGEDEDPDAHVSEDNWDDDSVEDDFSNQLQPELDKHGYKMETL
ncbi:26S proteasome complex subunit SEM1-like [Leopardus geoffroyi]|uniref:26S proteasome complex subunit SEM1-like n=1 Tax=Leopardus geoffroyi TaxID=46844 RepID=UPI001E26500E|nr:26S proteasome complex subunit SEM1-like [Leopardus geoffroyi]